MGVGEGGAVSGGVFFVNPSRKPIPDQMASFKRSEVNGATHNDHTYYVDYNNFDKEMQIEKGTNQWGGKKMDVSHGTQSEICFFFPHSDCLVKLGEMIK